MPALLLCNTVPASYVGVYATVTVTPGSPDPDDLVVIFQQTDSSFRPLPHPPAAKTPLVDQYGNVSGMGSPKAMFVAFKIQNDGSKPLPKFLFTDSPLEVTNSIVNPLHPWHSKDVDFLASGVTPDGGGGQANTCFTYNINSKVSYRIFGLSITDGSNYYTVDPKITNDGPISVGGLTP